MATIELTDTSSLVENVTVLDSTVLGKTPASVIHFLRSDVIGALNQTLDQVQINSLSIGFTYEPSFSLSGGTATFTAGGGATGELDLYKPGKAGTSSPLFPSDQYGTDIEMMGRYYLAFGLQLSLTTGLNQQTGAFTLTPDATTTSTSTLYLPFGPGPGGAFQTLKAALTALFGAFSLPSSIADIKALPGGAVFVYDAQGSVSFQASVDLLAAVNPTASLGVSTSSGPIKINVGPSITVGGAFSLTGEFQVRVWNTNGRVIQLGYYKKRGTTFSVSFDASAGAAVSVGGYDIVARIYSLLGDAGELDPAWLRTHIPDAVANDVQTAYQTAVQTKLSIAIDEECDTTTTGQVVFSWSFDTSVMDAAAQATFEQAIQGKLSSLMGGNPLPPGVTKLGSVFDRMKSTKHTFTFNFLGLFDYASVQEASLEMSVKVSEDGQVVIADKATLTRLGANATPLIKSALLRKVLVEDFIATVGYSTSFGAFAPQLQVNYSYYDYETHAHASDLQTFVSQQPYSAEETSHR